jgi:hypothetical protein
MVSSAHCVMSCGRTSSPCTNRPRGSRIPGTPLDGVQVILGRHVEHGVVLVVELRCPSASSSSPAPGRGRKSQCALLRWRSGSWPRSRCAAGSPDTPAPGPDSCSGTRVDDVARTTSSGLFMARLFTAVGLFRASIGPPIMVMLRGVASPALAISDTAASTGTVGWQTLITCSLSGRCGDELAHVGDVVVEVEGADLERHHARVDPVGDVDLVVRSMGAHGVAQQRGVMVSRQRRHHQHGRRAWSFMRVSMAASSVKRLKRSSRQKGAAGSGDRPTLPQCSNPCRDGPRAVATSRSAPTPASTRRHRAR